MKVFQTSIPSLMKVTNTTNITSIANFIIDDEFASLMPPPLEEEHTQLEANIVAEGTCHNPILVWEGHNILLDGHSRYEICTRLGLPFQVRTISLPDRDAARTWIIENQLGRRNLTPEGRSYLIGKLYESRKASWGGDRRSKGSKGSKYHFDTLIGDAAEQVAQEMKVGVATVKRGAQYAQAVDALASIHGEGVRTDLLTRGLRIAQGDVIDLAELEEEQQREILAGVRDKSIKGRQIGRRIWQAAQQQAKERPKAEMKTSIVGDAVDNISNFPPARTLERAQVVPDNGQPYGQYRILNGDALQVLHQLKEEGCQVNCVMTSPPYFLKRRYGEGDKDVDNAHEIGRESTVEEYIEHLVNVFGAVADVLHPLGSVWVNIGDKREDSGSRLMIPERFALAMQADGWLLADIVIWAKGVVNVNGTTVGGWMPEPAPGRLNGNGYEALFRFVRASPISKAWHDTCAVRIPREDQLSEDMRYLPPSLMRTHTHIEGRSPDNVWRIPPGQTSEDHYSVYPPELCERPIAMSCPMLVCSKCHAPRTRLVESQEDLEEYEKDEEYEENWSPKQFGKYTSNPGDPEISGRHDTGHEYVPRKPITLGWTDCGHKAYVSGVVLDPFSGSGTTGEVALKLGRSFIGIDLYPKFCEMTEKRCEQTVDYMIAADLNPQELAR